jgi:hypothetical protein
MQDHTQWTLACARIEMFRLNLPGLIDEDCVKDYHQIVESLEKAGEIDLSHFTIESARLEFQIMRSRSAGDVYPPQRIQYSSKRYCDRIFFCTQLERLVHFVTVDAAPS